MTIPSRPAPAPPVARGQSAAAGANASIEQLRRQLHQQQLQQQHNGGVQKLAISLPPPPKGPTYAMSMASRNNSISSNNNYNSNQSAITRKFPQARYTPTTNWDDDPFAINASSAANTNGNHKKVPPPRPPPPKVQVNGRKVPLPPSTRSTKLLSNIFRSKKNGNSSSSNNNNKASKIYGVSSGVYATNNAVVTTTTKSSHTNAWAAATSTAANGSSSGNSWQANWNSSYTSTSLTSLAVGNSSATSHVTEAQLISFDSPPSSPTFTQKSNSDCHSVDSFSSDSNFSSPNNGSVSQPESGFEDDFSARSRPATTSPLDPWEAFDSAFNTPTDSIYGSSAAASTIGTAPVRNLNTINARIQFSNDNPLCNGKSLLPPTPILSVPTIIKPKISQKPRAPKPPVLPKPLSTPQSLPMPLCAPPPPPNGVSRLDVIMGKADALQLGGDVGGSSGFGSGVEETIPYGVALYDFEGVEEGDLSFRENEKIYILEQVSAEWYRGRTRSGCEGIFPVNYIDVKVPLDEAAPAMAASSQQHTSKPLRVRCLYNFPAECDGDLALKENELVTILYKVNEDWLYGEVDGREGQFPANFLEYLPSNIPTYQHTS